MLSADRRASLLHRNLHRPQHSFLHDFFLAQTRGAQQPQGARDATRDIAHEHHRSGIFLATLLTSNTSYRARLPCAMKPVPIFEHPFGDYVSTLRGYEHVRKRLESL